MLLSVAALRSRKLAAAAAAWALALQVKQFAIFLAPFFLAEIFELIARRDRVTLKQLGFGFLAGTLMFLPFYWVRSDIWLLPLQTQSNRFNPFFWPFTSASKEILGWSPAWLTTWNAVATFLLLVAGVYGLTAAMKRRDRKGMLEALPLPAFIVLLKSLRWAEFWYTASVPVYLLGYKRSRFLTVLFLVYALQCGRSLALVIGRPHFGVKEYASTIERFAECRFTCDYTKP